MANTTKGPPSECSNVNSIKRRANVTVFTFQLEQTPKFPMFQSNQLLLFGPTCNDKKWHPIDSSQILANNATRLAARVTTRPPVRPGTSAGGEWSWTSLCAHTNRWLSLTANAHCCAKECELRSFSYLVNYKIQFLDNEEESSDVGGRIPPLASSHYQRSR
jgi:hypothetical protein